MTAALSSSPHVTAEWQCTRCDSTNRKYVPAPVTRTTDRCLSCRTRHEIVRADRPVRWNATPR